MSNNKYSMVIKFHSSQMDPLRTECNTVFPQCFHTGHSPKLNWQGIFKSNTIDFFTITFLSYFMLSS